MGREKIKRERERLHTHKGVAEGQSGRIVALEVVEMPKRNLKNIYLTICEK
jgi:hypothetical protein